MKGECASTRSGHTNGVYSLVCLPAGQLASGSEDNTIKLWDVSSGSSVTTLSGHTSVVVSLVVLPDGRLASGSYDNTINLWK